MSIKTQGTNLYAIDPADSSLIDVSCVTSLENVASQRGVVNIPACLADPSGRSSKSPGELTPGSVTFGINTDMSNPDHVRLHELLESGDEIRWALGWSDGPRNPDGTTAAPATVDSDDDFDLPDTRTWLVFNGFISTYPFNFPANAVVASTIGIEMTTVEKPIPRVAP